MPYKTAEDRAAYQLQYRKDHGEQLKAYDCERYYGREHERRKEAARKASQKPENREKHNATARRIREQDRTELIQKMGGKCSICGFSDERALQIDHVEAVGQNRKERNGYSYWRTIAKNIDAGDTNYQLLCANCHCIKTRENDEYNKARKKRRIIDHGGTSRVPIMVQVPTC